MDHLYPAMLKVNTYDDIQRWWEVMDRTTGAPVPGEDWRYDGESGNVVIRTVPFHQYTVSFLTYIMWDPVNMYNAVVNDWKDAEPQITFDVRQPKTHAHSMGAAAPVFGRAPVCGCDPLYHLLPPVYLGI